MNAKLFSAALFLLASAPVGLRAQNAPAVDPQAAVAAKLRDALRATTLQLRDAQTAVVEKTAALDAKTAEASALKKKFDAQTKQSAADRAAAAAKVAGLETKISGLEKAVKERGDLVVDWQAAAHKQREIAVASEAERVRLLAVSDRLAIRLADRETKNVRLIDLSGQILNRFEKFGLGDAIANREPFIGVKRVELQKLAQDYSASIAGQKVIPGKPAAGEETVAPKR